MNYHGNFTVEGKSHCMRFTCTAFLQLTWLCHIVICDDPGNVSLHLMLWSSPCISLQQFWPIFLLPYDYMFKHFRLIDSYIHWNKCHNIHFLRVPKIRDIHKNKVVSNGMWSNWSLRNCFGAVTKGSCLAVVQDVQHLHKSQSVPSVFCYGRYFLLVHRSSEWCCVLLKSSESILAMLSRYSKRMNLNTTSFLLLHEEN